MISKRKIRHKRVRAKVFGTSDKPRLSVYRSNKHVFLQLVDDEKGRTLLSASDKELKPKNKKTAKSGVAYEVGKLLAKKALGKNIKKTVFDRGGYLYHGRVKKVAEGARDGGLKL